MLVFIKSITKHNRVSRKSYTYQRLLESYRSERGPRHEVILNLGKLDLPREQWKLLADRIEDLVSGQGLLADIEETVERLAQHYAALLRSRGTKEDRRALAPLERTVDVRSLRSGMVRTIGAEYVGVEFYRRLGVERILTAAGVEASEQRLIEMLIVGRLVAPASERATLQWAKRRSGLSELVGSWTKSVSLSTLYRASDVLYAHKGRLEAELQREEQQLFNLQRRVILYDLTNTYFEGHHYRSAEVSYGKSKEKRSDCRLLTLGLVVDEWGFARKSEVFAGNAQEPATLQEMLGGLGAQSGSTVVVDAGIGTEDNLVKLREWGYHYLCVARGKPLAEAQDTDEGMVLIKASGENVVRGKLVKGDSEWVLRCDSSQRKAKEQAMKERFRERYEAGLAEIRSSLAKKGGMKNYEKVLQRLGRLKERSHGIHQYYEVTLEHDEHVVASISWKYAREKQADERYAGRYYIRTSRTDLDEKNLWELYVTLSGIEDSFRSMKGELGLRPVFHSRIERIKAHLFITVLAYHLLAAIRYRLRQHGYHFSWTTVRHKLSTHVVSTLSMKTTSGGSISVRTASAPEVEHRDIYRALGLRLSPFPVRRSETRPQK